MAKPKNKPKTSNKEKRPEQAKILKSLAAPILRLKFDLVRRVRILDSAIGAKLAGKYLLPAECVDTLARVHIALPADVVSILERAYPDRSYVGRSFQIIKHRYVSESRAYSKRAAYSVDEIEFQPAIESARRVKGSE